MCHGQNSVLYGYNTDGIYISNPKKLFKNKKDVKFSTNKIGKAYMTDNELLYFEKHYRENMNVWIISVLMVKVLFLMGRQDQVKQPNYVKW